MFAMIGSVIIAASSRPSRRRIFSNASRSFHGASTTSSNTDADALRPLTRTRNPRLRFARFREKLSPLVFYVGATGLLPDEIDAKALSADQLGAKYPDLALSKDEKEGTFFELGDTILSVYAKTEYFSRDVPAK